MGRIDVPIRALNAADSAARTSPAGSQQTAGDLGAPAFQKAQSGPRVLAPATQHGKPNTTCLTTDIVGLKVSTGEFCANADLIESLAVSGRGQWVLTLNLEMIARMATDTQYAALLRDVDFAVADGIPVVWLSHLTSNKLSIPTRTCGVDLVAHFLKNFQGRMGILGGSNADIALETLGAEPGRIVYKEQGEITLDRLDAIASDVLASGCQLLFVALGVPKQDYVCKGLRERCPGVVCIGVGGSFDILSGLIPRAPEWIQRIGLEWAYRLGNEPRRLWRRYLLHYPRAVPRILKWVQTERTKG